MLADDEPSLEPDHTSSLRAQARQPVVGAVQRARRELGYDAGLVNSQARQVFLEAGLTTDNENEDAVVDGNG